MKLRFLILFVLFSHCLFSQHELIIQLHHDQDFSEFIQKNKVFKSNAFSIVRNKRLSHSQNIHLIRITTNQQEVSQALKSIQQNPTVKSVSLNQPLENRSDPSDELFFHQWQLANTGIVGNVDSDIDATDAWDITTGGKTYAGDDIVVAILDNGINSNHPDLINNMWMNNSEIPNNGIDDDKNGFIDDIHGWNFNNQNNDVTNGNNAWHGTPVAGIIGAKGNNGIGVTGVNWDIKLMSLVANKTIADIISAYDYVLEMRKRYNESNGEEGAFIVATNASLGLSNAFAEDHPIWCDIYNALGEQGVLNVSATANGDVDVDKMGDMPTTCTSEYLVTVTNVNQSDLKSHFAAYGKEHVDLGAPGDAIVTSSNNGSYSSISGTSAAAPHVAGVIALLYSAPFKRLSQQIEKSPSETALLIKELILNSVDRLEDLDQITVSEGRLNAFKAILELQRSLEESPNELDNRGLLTNVYPNPSNGKLTIEMKMGDKLSCIHDSPDQIKKNIQLKIFDLSGYEVLNQANVNIDLGQHKLQIDISTLPSSKYILNLTSSDFSFTMNHVIVKE